MQYKPGDVVPFDPSEAIGNNKLNIGHIIQFAHVPTNDTATFKAFLTSWQDQFKQNWKSYETVGRMDPIMIYSRTGRQITFSFDIPSFGPDDALYNMVQVERLTRMCYPTFSRSAYSSTTNSTTVETEQGEVPGRSETASQLQTNAFQFRKTIITRATRGRRTATNMISPPLMRISFANWIRDTDIDTDFASNFNEDRSKQGTDKSRIGSGLYGVVENVKFAPELGDASGFYTAKDYGEEDKNYLIPKLLKIDIIFTVLHSSELGYDSKTRQLRTAGFPYNAENILYNYQQRKLDIEIQKGEILVEAELAAKLDTDINKALNNNLSLPGQFGQYDVKKFEEQLQITQDYNEGRKTTVSQNEKARQDNAFADFLKNQPKQNVNGTVTGQIVPGSTRLITDTSAPPPPSSPPQSQRPPSAYGDPEAYIRGNRESGPLASPRSPPRTPSPFDNPSQPPRRGVDDESVGLRSDGAVLIIGPQSSTTTTRTR